MPKNGGRVIMHMKARTVEECWRIARHDAEMYQRRIATMHARGDYAGALNFQGCRDAADRIALRIRYGRRRKRDGSKYKKFRR